jgi:hypothetical protein
MVQRNPNVGREPHRLTGLCGLANHSLSSSPASAAGGPHEREEACHRVPPVAGWRGGGWGGGGLPGHMVGASNTHKPEEVNIASVGC